MSETPIFRLLADPMPPLDLPRPEKMPAPGGRYGCPVDDCAWNVDVPAPTTAYKYDDAGFRFALHGVDPGHLESVLGEHFGTHPAVDYLQTIRRLNNEVAQLRADATERTTTDG